MESQAKKNVIWRRRSGEAVKSCHLKQPTQQVQEALRKWEGHLSTCQGGGLKHWKGRATRYCSVDRQGKFWDKRTGTTSSTPKDASSKMRAGIVAQQVKPLSDSSIPYDHQFKFWLLHFLIQLPANAL